MMPNSTAAEINEQKKREARLALPEITAEVVIGSGVSAYVRTVAPYLSHKVSDKGTLMVFTRDANGDEWPALTVAPGQWVLVRVIEPEDES